jgi:hypothetical protein
MNLPAAFYCLGMDLHKNLIIQPLTKYLVEASPRLFYNHYKLISAEIIGGSRHG